MRFVAGAGLGLRWVWVFAAVGLTLGAWSLATPLGAAPDEPEHLIQASALVRGQFDGPRIPAHFGRLVVGQMGTVSVPAWITDIADPKGVLLDSPNCSQSACSLGAPLGLTSTRSIASATQFSNYPPLFYLTIGWPTLIATGPGALYGVRVLVVVINSALIALGFFLLPRYRPVALIGAFVALTPTMLFFGSVANSSGTEIACGFAAWCGGLCIIETKKAPRSLVVWSAGSFVGLVLCRPTSWITALAILLVLGAFAGWGRCREMVLPLRCLWVAVGAAVAASVMFLGAVGPPSLLGVPEHLDLVGRVSLTLRAMGGELQQLSESSVGSMSLRLLG